MGCSSSARYTDSSITPQFPLVAFYDIKFFPECLVSTFFSKIRYGSVETSRHYLVSLFWIVLTFLSYGPLFHILFAVALSHARTHAQSTTVITLIWQAQCSIPNQWIQPATINEVLLWSRSRNAKHLAGGDTNGFNKTVQGDLVVLSNFLLPPPSSSVPSLRSHL